MDVFTLLSSFVFGIAAGTLGALPFLHQNNLLAALSSLSLAQFQAPLAASVFAVALSFSHLAFQTIPTLFLAIPSQNQSVAALPAQRLVLRGRAEHALFIIARSLFLGLLASLCVAPLALLLLPPLYAFAKPLSAFVLAAIVGLAVASEKSVARGVAALGVFLLSGAVGFAALALPLAAAPLFPLLAGLFGVPALLFSFGAKPAKFSCEAASERAGEGLRLAAVDWRLVLSGVGVGALSVLFPALSPALLCGAIFLFLESDAESFLEASSALVASKMLFDFAGVFAIGKARSGAAAFVLESFASRGASASLADYALVCLAALAALGLGLAALVVLRRRFAALFERAAGSAFSAALLVLIAIGSLVFSGFGGVLVLAAAAAAGCVAPLLGLKRSFAMGALFVPSILFSLGAAAGVTQLFY